MNSKILTSKAGIDRNKYWIVELKGTGETEGVSSKVLAMPKSTVKRINEVYPSFNYRDYFDTKDKQKIIFRFSGDDGIFYTSTKVDKDMEFYPEIVNCMPQSGKDTITFTFGRQSNFYGYKNDAKPIGSYVYNGYLKVRPSAFWVGNNGNGYSSVKFYLNNFSVDKYDYLMTRIPLKVSMSPIPSTNNSAVNAEIRSEDYTDTINAFNDRNSISLGNSSAILLQNQYPSSITSGTTYTISWSPV